MPTTSRLLSPDFLARLEKLELVSRKMFRGRLKGERRSPRKGQSVEFADYRNYVQGDDLRFLDWNTYARLERLFLKLFLEEEDLHFHVLIDNSRSMGFGEPEKMYYAKQLAAALGFIGLVRSDRVKIELLGRQEGLPLPPLRGRRQLWQMLDVLEPLEAEGSISLLEGVHRFCLRCSGKGIVVLISDLFDKQGFEQPLRLLAAQGMDSYVIHVLSPEELSPTLQGDLQLVDSEDGDRAEVTISEPLLKRYRETLEAFVGAIRAFCARRGITYLLVPTSVPVEKLVTLYLQRRGLVR